MPDDSPARDPVNDADLISLLQEIKARALSKYPFTKDDGPLDPHLCMTLGQIAGIVDAAIMEYQK